MLGAIVGDIVGSVYEHNNHRSKDFPLFTEQSHFTDDTILTIATAHALMSDHRKYCGGEVGRADGDSEGGAETNG